KALASTGISVWTLLNWWERAGRFGSSAADFGDGKLNVPEGGNGVPDLLDEARWALEFELKMLVPEGQPLAGMAHQSLRDRTSNSLGIAPHQDPKERVLYRPTTAATLNVAANAAQAARLFRPFDPAFAARCLAAAERAWSAATAHPAEYARPDGLGGYDDGDVSDEFYWAAAELYITTKKPAYKASLLRSPHYGSVPSVLPAGGGDEGGLATPMNWRRVQALGSISLAVAPNELGDPAVDKIRKNVVAAADAFGAIARREGYRVPFRVGPAGYPWGSNSFVLNNLLIAALAYDFTGRPAYRDDVAVGMDYLLGRNPMDQSYVTGYGHRALKHPHHRFFSSQANRHYPEPPPGLLSGGPNSGLEDQHVQSAGLKGCAPAKCFRDDVDSFSTNGVSLNWNAPLVWVAAFLDEQAGRRAARPAPGASTLAPQKAPR
ncbi:MAG TPA: glycoside hydrolase family 9 protein, partial [Polyangiaceae bacterium]|nr:glycoside hydrolase family 9 protein [Polyangiaceae bacterium]